MTEKTDHSDFKISYTGGMEPSFELVQDEEGVLRVVKQVDLSVDHEPQEALEAAARLINDAATEGLVAAEDKEKLIKEARKRYNRDVGLFW